MSADRRAKLKALVDVLQRRWGRLPVQWWGVGGVIVAFIVSTCLYHARGVRFDASPIPSYDQLLDPLLLRTRLWQSLLYLHGQPPLYNLLTGIALKLSPDDPKQVLLPVYVLSGLYTGVCQYVIMLRLRVPVVVSMLIASAIVCSPAFVLHENWYFYPHLNVAWLSGGVAWLGLSRGRPGREMAIAAFHFAGLSLTRSLFHPLVFALTVLVTVTLVSRSVRRKSLACFALPSLLVFLWCAKNQALFGFFGTSSWGSRNVSNSVKILLGKTRIEAEASRGTLSPALLVPSVFESGGQNQRTFGLEPRQTGIPALDNERKQVQSNHSVSYNHWTYAATSHFYAEDARQLIERYPVAYLRGLLARSVPSYFRPVNDDWLLWRNRKTIARETNGFDAFETSDAVRTLLALGLALSLAAMFARSTARDQRLLLAVAFLLIAWVTTVGIVGEIGENNRFRFKVLWLSFTVACAGYAWAIRQLGPIALQRWRRARLLNSASSPETPR